MSTFGREQYAMVRIIIGFGLAAVFGAAMGLVVGHYIVQGVPGESLSLGDPLSVWLKHPIGYGHWKWALGGALIGLAIRYFAVDD